MFNPLYGLQGIGQLLYVFRISSYSNNLQTVFMTNVNVLRGNNQFLIIVLYIGNLVQEALAVMIIYEGNSAGNIFPFSPLFL